MRCALYMRVSTGDQKTDMQRRELVELCSRRGWEIVAEYADIGVSGSKDSRPQLNRLMADAHKGRFNVIAVWKFDRFARSVSHLLRALETFQSLGIEFCSYSESIDTSSAYGKMVFTILGAVAELERSLTAERVKAGMKSASARGVRLGRRAVQVDAGEVHRRRAAGQTFESIAKELRVSLRTVYRNSRRQIGK
jgi:DNA invertase Pin-like site-specific DNA recombinase